MYKDISAYDMSYHEFYHMCREIWRKKINYLCNDMSKNKNEGKYRIFNLSKFAYFEYICESEAF